MEYFYLGMVIFLFLLAIFDLFVGVSNDAVNFLNSAIGSKAARFRTIMIVSAVGIFLGASMSNGMMDVARHGIFRPEMFSFNDLMCVFLAVMVTDIILLDVFNSLGMPTSTTVSMVFELLGSSFALATIKSLSAENTLLSDYLNSEKALSVIIAIFFSVGIAFVFGTLIQWLARLLFTFDYRHHMKWNIGIFGGVALTSIVYFMLFKGMKDLTFMTADTKAWMSDHSMLLLGGCFVVFTLLMQLLAWMKVSVLKVVVLSGTFALAMAFAGNDLVNFIGVPLAGYSSYIDFTAAGATDPTTYMMNSLNEPAVTPIVFLVSAGAIMVFSLVTSKKAYNVVKTSVNLSRQEEGDEMFGSSRVARSIVRWASSCNARVASVVPTSVQRWIDSRFDTKEVQTAEGAAFDLVRASVNLVVAALLIALGTSLKLPLSTTYVTFIVAMGSSLADRAWSRESAVFRITGVLAVIGGWFITAGVAFISCAIVAMIIYFGGKIVTILLVIGAIVLLVWNNVKYGRRKKEEKKDVLFTQMLQTKNRVEVWPLLRRHLGEYIAAFVGRMSRNLNNIDEGLIHENLRILRRTQSDLQKEKPELKNLRRKETLCLRRCDAEDAMSESTWFHLAHNSMEQMHYCLVRMNDACREHVDNNFSPLPEVYAEEYDGLSDRLLNLLARIREDILSNGGAGSLSLRGECKTLREEIIRLRYGLQAHIREKHTNLTTAYLYLNLLQESEVLVTILRQLLRSVNKLQTKE